ncbi:hypothetical protein Tco_1404729 [Tanacetum coccineum]
MVNDTTHVPNSKEQQRDGFGYFMWIDASPGPDQHLKSHSSGTSSCPCHSRGTSSRPSHSSTYLHQKSRNGRELKLKRSKLALPVLQGFREARKLKQGALYLYVGNGVRAQVEAIGSYDLVLPNGLVICLDNCHYAPSITRGVVSVHRLVENGFV